MLLSSPALAANKSAGKWRQRERERERHFALAKEGYWTFIMPFLLFRLSRVAKCMGKQGQEEEQKMERRKTWTEARRGELHRQPRQALSTAQ
jgi:hypothetical protein